MRVLDYEDLSSKGIKYSRQHIHRLVRLGKFPAPFKLNGGDNGPNHWLEHIIDRHIETCAAKHDTGSIDNATRESAPAQKEQGVQAIKP